MAVKAKSSVVLSKRQDITGFRVSVAPKGIQEIREMVHLERELKGWTQEQLAERASCHTNTVYNLESGRTTLWRRRTVVLIFNALGYDVTVSARR